MRILALDWGTVRIGAAISDESETIATPFEKPIDPKHAIQEIKEITERYDIGLIVLGYPKTLSNQESKSTKSVEVFRKKVEELGVKIELADERLSSILATQRLSEQELSSKASREIKDNLTAQIFLEEYLKNKSK